MTVLPIVTWPDPVLAQVCTPIENPASVGPLAKAMLETMYAAPGRGLAAPQVGVLKRVFVMDPGWKEDAPDPVICINPTITVLGETQLELKEGCLSIPGIVVPVVRPGHVRLDYTDLDGQAQSRDLEGFAALCAQHELDHLDGIVTLDRVSPADRDQLIADYQNA